MNAKKRPGRPRKIKTEEKNNKDEKKKDEDENIVLFLALNSDEENKNTDTKNNNKSEIETSDNKTETKRFIQDDSSDKEEEDEDLTKLMKKNEKKLNKIQNKMSGSSKDIEILLNEIKKKDAIIIKLKEKHQNKNLISSEDIKKTKINYHCTHVKDLNSCKSFEPKNNNLSCWWCDHPFDNIPVYIPDSYKEGNYYVFGNFCSFNCALRYNKEQYKDYKSNTRTSLLHNFKYKLTGDDTPIKPADDRELLKSKGGKMDIKTFRHNFLVNNLNTKLSMPPVIPLIHTINKSSTEKL